MLVLFETPAGYALFKVLDETKLEKVTDIIKAFNDSETASEVVQLQAFKKFKDTKEALLATDKLISGLFPKTLEKFLKKNIISKEVQDSLVVADKKLGALINTKLGIDCLHNKKMDELYRGIRTQINSLVEGLSETEMKNMTLGLAHGLSRYKLKFSTEKVDTMIIQAISLLEDLDKEINNFMMRLREWFGWHFPELSKVVTDNVLYAKTVKAIGMKSKVAGTDLSEILPEEIEAEVKQAAEVSMGTEITEVDESFIMNLAQQVIDLSEYRDSLNEYLKSRMNAVAPNLTTMVGELVGAKLISHAGSLINLAKYPASTIQILGAEKALFRAMRTKHNTPKYGLIYQASLVGQSHAKIKGKVSRTLAAKCSVCIRVDALGESENAEVGQECKTYVEKRQKFLENNINQQDGGAGFKKGKPQSHHREQAGGYNAESDFSLGRLPKLQQTFVPAASTKRKAQDEDDVQDAEKDASKKKKKKQQKDSDDDDE
jgi:nucleolar protein 58